MTIRAGNRAIRLYVQANWSSPVPMGYPGHPFTVAAPSIRMTIQTGARNQGSIGRVQNQVHQIGNVHFQIFTEGGIGTDEADGLCDTLIDLFHGKVLDADGAVVTSQSQTPVVRFSPPELGQSKHPYIAARVELDDAPYLQTNLICPYVRYELR